MKDDHGTWTTMTILAFTMYQEGPPWGLNDKESACQAGDLGLIPVLGRFPGEGIGYPLQDSRASLVAQTAKNLPSMRETWV